jgi:predicted nucleotide-binding protein
VQLMMPSGQVMSRDMLAMSQGFRCPPHLELRARMTAVSSPFTASEKLGSICMKAASHLRRQESKRVSAARIGTNVFIGHGRSSAWRDLKDFLKDRLGLPYDEFNRVPVAGITNIARLSEMLDAAAVAFVVLTAEDEQADGKLHARMNVIHEVGLFQGRLGFTKAIVLLEETCEEFSNIQGLGQIRFPKGNIAAKFEEIRRVLEREGLIQGS